MAEAARRGAGGRRRRLLHWGARSRGHCRASLPILWNTKHVIDYKRSIRAHKFRSPGGGGAGPARRRRGSARGRCVYLGRRRGAAAHLPAPGRLGGAGSHSSARSRGGAEPISLKRPQLQAGSAGLTGSRPGARGRCLSPPCACAGAAAGRAREGGVDAGTRGPQRRAGTPRGVRGARCPLAARPPLPEGHSLAKPRTGAAFPRPLVVRETWMNPGPGRRG